MPSTNLSIVDVPVGNIQEIHGNSQIEQARKATQSRLQITVTGNTTVTAAQWTRNLFFDLSGSPGAGFNLDVPATAHRFIVRNATGQTGTVQVTGGGGASVALPTAKTRQFYCDGTDVIAITPEV